MDYRNIDTYVNDTDSVNVVVEIPKGSRLKYELCGETKGDGLTVVKSFHKGIPHLTDIKYPYNYGIICGTWAPDGDQLDAIILGSESILPLTLLKCKVIGVIRTIEDNVQDDKFIVLPEYLKMKSFNLRKILKFLKKQRKSDGKEFTITEVLTADAAHELIKEQILYLKASK